MIWRSRSSRAQRGDVATGDLPAVRLLLLAGRSPDEQHLLLDRLGCLSSRGRADRMGVIRLLDRVYEAEIREGLPPITPSVMTAAAPVDALELLGPAGGQESGVQRLVRRQARALIEAGYLDGAACRTDDVSTWWAEAWPQVSAIHQEQNPIFAAVASEKSGKGEKMGDTSGKRSAGNDDDPVTAFRAVLTPIPETKAIQRTDPITCPTCGRPAPRRATYCVWCGLWLAARPR